MDVFKLNPENYSAVEVTAYASYGDDDRYTAVVYLRIKGEGVDLTAPEARALNSALGDLIVEAERKTALRNESGAARKAAVDL